VVNRAGNTSLKEMNRINQAIYDELKFNPDPDLLAGPIRLFPDLRHPAEDKERDRADKLPATNGHQRVRHFVEEHRAEKQEACAEAYQQMCGRGQSWKARGEGPGHRERDQREDHEAASGDRGAERDQFLALPAQRAVSQRLAAQLRET